MSNIEPIDKKNSLKRNMARGYTLVELLFYVALFAVLTLAVIRALLVMTRSFRETTIQAELSASSDIMERMIREVRQANAIVSLTASDLKLNTKDDAGAAKTVEFLLSGTNVQLLENSILTGNLNAPNISVTGLSFVQITTAQGLAVKLVLTVKSKNDALSRTESFYDTVVLRGGY